MDELSSFWSGAVYVARRVDTSELARRAGGWRALEEGGEPLLRALGLDPELARQWVTTAPSRTRGRALTLADPAYPTRLREITRPPPVLFVEGSVDALHRPAVGVVGTRSCSQYGRSIAARLGGALAAAGMSVVSGLARGIDACAHEAALSQGLTVAVLGHGLDYTAPRSNLGLRRAIGERGSTIVTTWPDDTPPRPHRFPIRNRWIAGLVDAVVVVEAGRRSGALITAREAASEGRLVFAVPGYLGAPGSEGCNRLLGCGALCVDDLDDFVWSMSGELLPAVEAWLEMVFAGASLDEVAGRFKLSPSVLLGRLAQLELEGTVVRTGVQRYAPGRSFP